LGWLRGAIDRFSAATQESLQHFTNVTMVQRPAKCFSCQAERIACWRLGPSVGKDLVQQAPRVGLFVSIAEPLFQLLLNNVARIFLEDAA
jgi:hypothetical protein